jgi:hypothetical protein
MLNFNKCSFIFFNSQIFNKPYFITDSFINRYLWCLSPKGVIYSENGKCQEKILY